jgi:hypothetical protein
VVVKQSSWLDESALQRTVVILLPSQDSWLARVRIPSPEDISVQLILISIPVFAVPMMASLALHD